MRIRKKIRGYLLQRLAIATLAAIPVTVWAPNDLVKSDILEVTIEFRVISGAAGSGKTFLSESQSRHVTDFLNRQLGDRGIRFNSLYLETTDNATADLSTAKSKAQALQRVEKFARPGMITVIIPAKVKASAAYLGQALESGPIGIYGGTGGTLGIAQVVGTVFGFSKICGVANNIMYGQCASHPKAEVKSLSWSYFTDDQVSQTFSQSLDLWKWEAQSFLVSRARKNASGALAGAEFTDTQSTP